MKSYTELYELAASDGMKPSRLQHSVGVATTAKFLLERFGYDGNPGLIAGIFHDWYRYVTDLDALKEIQRALFKAEPEEISNPMLLHGAVAAIHMREIVGEDTPDEYLTAVRWHTLGSPDMGILGAAIYVADFAEPGRKHLEDEEKHYILSMDSLEEMVLYILRQQDEYFKRTGKKGAQITGRLKAFLEAGNRFN